MAANARVFPFGQGFLQMQKDLNRIPVRYSQSTRRKFLVPPGFVRTSENTAAVALCGPIPDKNYNHVFRVLKSIQGEIARDNPVMRVQRNWQPPLRFPTGCRVSDSGFQRRRQIKFYSQLEATHSSAVKRSRRHKPLCLCVVAGCISNLVELQLY